MTRNYSVGLVLGQWFPGFRQGQRITMSVRGRDEQDAESQALAKYPRSSVRFVQEQ